MLDFDLLFVLGICLGVLILPAVVSAILDGRAPRTPALLLIISALMIGYAVLQKPTGYSLASIPDVFANVIARYTN